MNLTITGKVIEGNKIGTSIGYPTANVSIDPMINIIDGVYFVKLIVDNYNYKGVANVGIRPTVTNGEQRLLEVHIFDYKGEIYGKVISIKLVEFIREEKTFDSIEDMKYAIDEDVKHVQSIIF